MQEYYECQHKNIKGKKFTLEDLIVAYCELDDRGEFKYFDEWIAFNIPDVAVRGFIEVMGASLMEREKRVINDIVPTLEDNTNTPASKTYYLATFTEHNNESHWDLKHEIAHGLFYTQSMYHKIMMSLVNGNKSIEKKMFPKLREMKYCDDVLTDEAQAYLSTSSVSELKDFGFNWVTEKDTRPFKRAYKQFTSVKSKKKGLLCEENLFNENQSRTGKQQTTRQVSSTRKGLRASKSTIKIQAT